MLSAILEGCKGLKSLVLESNNIKSERAITLVADLLTNNNKMTVISLEGNQIGDVKANILYKAMKSSQLHQLCLSATGITLPNLVVSKKATRNLTHLDLSGGNSSNSRWCWNGNYYSRNVIKTPGAKLIATYLERNPALIELNLQANRINSSAGKLIAASLKKNTNLQQLIMRYNRLTDKCIPAFEDALKHNTTLLSLDLSKNNIKVETGRKNLIRSIMCDPMSLEAVANSNHTFNLIMNEGSCNNTSTFGADLCNINSLDKSEGVKIRYKVVLTLFAMNPDLFSPQTFLGVPLELMPCLLEIAQQEIGYDGFGEGVVGEANKKRYGVDPTLNRLYAVIKGWNTPLLFNVSSIRCVTHTNIYLSMYLH